MAKYVCGICGYIYDEDIGIPSAGIKAGTRFEDLPKDWKCPLCGAPKSAFAKQAVMESNTEKPIYQQTEREQEIHQQGSHQMKELSAAQMSALCANLAKGCEKQYLTEEAGLFLELSEFYKKKAGTIDAEAILDVQSLVEDDLKTNYPNTNALAAQQKDRGALRALVWSEKVTRMIESILTRYQSEKDAMLAHTDIYVCEICGFIYIGDTPPAICPVCKVPNKKLTKIEGGE